MRLVVASLALIAALASVRAAEAQATGRPGIEAGFRLVAMGPIRFDGAPANLISADGRPYALFTVSNSVGAELGIEGHVSAPLSAVFRAEGAVSVAQPTLRTRVSDDVEGADPVTVTDRLTRVSLEAALVAQVHRGRSSAWFVRAGGGWTRGVTSDRSLMAKGTVATVGSGVKYWVRGGPRRRGGFGVDAEGRVVARWQGLTLDGVRLHIVPAVVAGLFFGF
ncbi:MAG: hypothetical protein ABI634_04290 [Acidobacteriota bacterium]